MRQVCRQLALALPLLGLMAGTTMAVTRSISVPATAMTVYNGALSSTTIALPNAGTPGLGINFTLPLDYVNDTPVTVQLLGAQAADPGCTAKLVLTGHIRMRNGAPVVFNIAPPIVGLTLGNSGKLTFAGAYRGAVLAIVVKPINSGIYQHLKRGEMVTFSVARDSGSLEDTCSDLVNIGSALIRYKAR